ncbi:MAG: YceD family protein [Minwuia sp.]|uniref:YceD family protein n=1 Tax=Minwuia sp. TaxID=2493630 RepID=UPI003A892963
MSRWLDVSAIRADGMNFHVEMDEAARQALCEQLDLVSLERLEADGRIWPADDGVFVDFQLKAALEQACVVTLEPVGQMVDERISLHYTPATSVSASPTVIDIDDEDDPPEPMVDGRIDIGAAMAEHLALGLDPWPRRLDAEMPAEGTDTADARENPFAVLARLKERMNGDDPAGGSSGG